MTEPTREMYLVFISYDQPVNGIAHIPARSEEHARELALAGYESFRNFKVIDVVKESEVQHRDKMVIEEPVDEPALPDTLDPKKNRLN